MLFMTINSLKGYYWTRRRKKQEQIVTDKRKKKKNNNNDKTKQTATQPRNASTTRFGHVLMYLF